MSGEFRRAARPGAALLVLGLVVGTAPAATATASAQGPGAVGLVLKANKETYRPGEAIGLTLQVLNRSSQPVTLTFRNAQRYDVVVQDARGDAVWRWSAAESFAQVIGEETLAPRGEITYRVAVRNKRFPPGRYTVVGMIPAEEGAMSTRVQITVQ